MNDEAWIRRGGSEPTSPSTIDGREGQKDYVGRKLDGDVSLHLTLYFGRPLAHAALIPASRGMNRWDRCQHLCGWIGNLEFFYSHIVVQSHMWRKRCLSIRFSPLLDEADELDVLLRIVEGHECRVAVRYSRLQFLIRDPLHCCHLTLLQPPEPGTIMGGRQFPVSSSLCHHVIMSLCHHVIMSFCHFVIMSLRQYVSVQPQRTSFVTSAYHHRLPPSLERIFQCRGNLNRAFTSSPIPPSTLCHL